MKNKIQTYGTYKNIKIPWIKIDKSYISKDGRVFGRKEICSYYDNNPNAKNMPYVEYEIYRLLEKFLDIKIDGLL